MKNIVIDLDGTLTVDTEDDYQSKPVNKAVKQRLIEYKSMGFRIVIHTARNMRTFSGNIGEINVHTLPVILDWLNRNEVPYDEVIIGKPWCGVDGFYVDDKSIRPSEFEKLNYEQIQGLLIKENSNKDSGNKT